MTYSSFQDCYVYLTVNEDFFLHEDKDTLVWNRKLTYGNWEDGTNRDGTHQITVHTSVPESVQENGTWYIHVFMAKAGHTLDPQSPNYKEQAITYQSAREWGGGGYDKLVTSPIYLKVTSTHLEKALN